MAEISVVITAYKLEKMLPACLDELLGGTFQDFNILIVDDCSPDATAEVIRRYESAYPEKIRGLYLPQNLGSPAKTRNAAMDSGLIDGEYVIFLDGDDSAEPDFLEKLYVTARKTGADITICGYDRVEADTGHVLCREMQGFPPVLMLPPQDQTLAYANTSLWNKLIRTQLIGDIRIPDFKVGEDLCFVLQLYANSNKLSFLEDVLIHYRVRPGSVIASTDRETIFAFARELEAQLGSSREPGMTRVLALAALIHIGISMMLRARDNKQIDLRDHLKWTRAYLLRNDLLSWRRIPLSAFFHNGIKGLGVLGCQILHRIHCFRLFLAAYDLITKTLHIDIKF